MSKNLTGKDLNDVHKLTFLANEFPNKNLGELIGIFELSPLDLNSAIWRAQDHGFLHINEGTSKVVVDTVPKKWEFGSAVEYLLEAIPYTFKKLAEQQSDMEENYFSNWTGGYTAQDVMVAMRKLIADKVMADYFVTDVSDSKGKKEINKYTFYTLAENRYHMWGRKQFKKDPLGKGKK